MEGGGGACTFDVRARHGMVLEGLSMHFERRGGGLRGVAAVRSSA